MENKDAASAVAAIFEQIPDMAKIAKVKKRDGTLVDFAPPRIGMTIADALRRADAYEEVSLAHCTLQALTRIERDFDERATPTTEDLVRVIASVLVANDLGSAAAAFLDAQNSSAPRRAPTKGVRCLRLYTAKGMSPAAECKEPVRGIVAAIAAHGRAHGYFGSGDDALAFEDELAFALAEGRAEFGAPTVIGSVRDGIRDVSALAAPGAGGAANVSALRDAVSPEAFTKAIDALRGQASAAAITLDADHPLAAAFIAADTRAARSIRVSEEFMRACDAGEPPRALIKTIVERGIGLVFDGAANRANTVPNAGHIGAVATNGFSFIDGTAAVAASINLRAFIGAQDRFDIDGFLHVVDILIVAADISCDMSAQPTPALTQRTVDFRPLAIGLTGLEETVARCVPSGANADRFAAALAAALTGRAYRQSARLADGLRPFRFYRLNEKAFLRVIGAHRDQARSQLGDCPNADVAAAAKRAWEEAFEAGLSYGYRNAQVSAIALPDGARLATAAAIQPFVSGAVAVRLAFGDKDSAEERVKSCLEAWRSGLKAIAFAMPLTSAPQAVVAETATAPRQQTLPAERASITHDFSVAGHKGTVIVGLGEDGRPCELSVRMGKGGSTVAGLVDAFSVAASLALRNGVSFEELAATFMDVGFAPQGETGNADIPSASSIIDYVFRWMGKRFSA